MLSTQLNHYSLLTTHYSLLPTPYSLLTASLSTLSPKTIEKRSTLTPILLKTAITCRHGLGLGTWLGVWAGFAMTCRHGVSCSPQTHTAASSSCGIAMAYMWHSCLHEGCRLCLVVKAAMTVTGSVAEIRLPKVSEASAPMGSGW